MYSCGKNARFCLALAIGSIGFSGAQAGPFTVKAGCYAVQEIPLTQIAADLASGKTTALAVTTAYIQRINAFDGALHSVILIAPDALEQARASDKRRRAGHARGRLDGIPILLKDNIDAIGMPTTAGSFALADNYPVRDSEVSRRLRAAGAVILGKTNLDQFAGFRTTRTFSGSTVGGTPHNPYGLDRSAAGSSNGSGIAAAVSFAAATVGTDTTGSIIAPSGYMGLAGMRPTRALVSRRGIVPISLSQDTAGPMARNVADLAAVLTAMSGTDPADPASADADAHKADYVKGLDRGVFEGVRIGVVRNVMGYDERTSPLFDAALATMAREGATLVDVPIGEFEDLFPEQIALMSYEFQEDLEAYLASTPPAVKTRTLVQLMDFSAKDPRENMHGEELFQKALASGGRKAPGYRETLEHAWRRSGPEGLGRAMNTHDVAALVLLAPGPAVKIVPDGAADAWFVKSARKGSTPIYGSGLSALSGYPDLTVPMGQIDGLPVGISFIGRPWSDQLLLSLGYAYEQAAHSRRPPPPLKPAPKEGRASRRSWWSAAPPYAPPDRRLLRPEL